MPWISIGTLSLQRRPACRSQFNVKDVRFIRSRRGRAEKTATLLFQRPTRYMVLRARTCVNGRGALVPYTPPLYTPRYPFRVLVRSRVARSNASAPTTVAQTVSIYVRIKILGYQIRARARLDGRAGARKKGCGKRKR
jgi:hypothetical protein